MNTTVLVDHEPVADGGFLVHALLRIEGAMPEDRDRAPLNLMLAICSDRTCRFKSLQPSTQCRSNSRRTAPSSLIMS